MPPEGSTYPRVRWG